MFATLARRNAANAVKSAAKADDPVKKGARRDPELYVLLTVMCGAFGLAGYTFARKPTSATSEENINIAEQGQPWRAPADAEKTEDYKYKYHPDGNSANAPKEAPSALHTVVVPNVNLPKSLHEKHNKWGKEGY